MRFYYCNEVHVYKVKLIFTYTNKHNRNNQAIPIFLNFNFVITIPKYFFTLHVRLHWSYVLQAGKMNFIPTNNRLVHYRLRENGIQTYQNIWLVNADITLKICFSINGDFDYILWNCLHWHRQIHEHVWRCKIHVYRHDADNYTQKELHQQQKRHADCQ